MKSSSVICTEQKPWPPINKKQSVTFVGPHCIVDKTPTYISKENHTIVTLSSWHRIHLTLELCDKQIIRNIIIAHFWGESANKVINILPKRKHCNLYGKAISHKVIHDTETELLRQIEINVNRCEVTG